MTDDIRVLVIDDHALLGDALDSVLALSDDIEPIGVFTSFDDAVAEVHDPPPDVVVLDYGVGDAADNMRVLRHHYPDASVLVFTGNVRSEALSEAIKAGCAGYVLKSQPLTDLVGAIRTVHEGGSVVPAHLLRAAATHMQAQEAEPHGGLSPRELEVLALLADGKSLLEIGHLLDIRHNTVRNHVQRILRKLDARSQREAVVIALRRGIVGD